MLLLRSFSVRQSVDARSMPWLAYSTSRMGEQHLLLGLHVDLRATAGLISLGGDDLVGVSVCGLDAFSRSR